MDINIGIKNSNRQKVIEALNILLADEAVLYQKTRNYHWHVTGSSFMELHKFLEGQYEELAEKIDEVAERVVTLGGKAIATLVEFSKKSRLKEVPGERLSAKKMLSNLVVDHESIIIALREVVADCDEKYGDAGSADFLTGLMEAHEKMAWMLRSYLD